MLLLEDELPPEEELPPEDELPLEDELLEDLLEALLEESLPELLDATLSELLLTVSEEDELEESLPLLSLELALESSLLFPASVAGFAVSTEEDFEPEATLELETSTVLAPAGALSSTARTNPVRPRSSNEWFR